MGEGEGLGPGVGVGCLDQLFLTAPPHKLHLEGAGYPMLYSSNKDTSTKSLFMILTQIYLVTAVQWSPQK